MNATTYIPYCYYYMTAGCLSYTSAKIILFNEWGCRDGIHHEKNHGNKVIPLAILSRILAHSCVTPPYIIKAKSYTYNVHVPVISS